MSPTLFDAKHRLVDTMLSRLHLQMLMIKLAGTDAAPMLADTDAEIWLRTTDADWQLAEIDAEFLQLDWLKH